jgi:hypothetical protein
MKRTPCVISADIAASGTKSGEIDLGGLEVTHLVMPAAFVGTAITFEAASAPGGTFYPVYDSAGAAVTVTVAQQKHTALSQEIRNSLRGLRIIKIVSGSTETAAVSVGLQVS